MLRKAFYLYTFIIVNVASAQISESGIPVSTENNLSNNFQFITLNSFDADKLLDEDNAIGEKAGVAMRFAKTFKVQYNLNNSGTWVSSNGINTWRIGIRSSGAFSLNVIFSKFYLPDGCKLYIYDPGKKQIKGAYTIINNNKYHVLATEPIAGDTIIVELNVPEKNKSEIELEIGKISHDYKGIFNLIERENFYDGSGDCNVDINCAEGNSWQKVKHSVVKMVIDGSKLCTGTLINNTKNDGIPYLLTANHCVNTNQSATETVFYFNYESPVCDGPDGSESQTLSGSGLKATAPNQKLDFALLELNDNIPLSYNPYFAGWNRNITAAENTTCIHHPQGDVKKISVDEDAPITGNYGSTYDQNSHWQIVEWDLGTTEGGSSGSPLFDENKRIIGDLTGGEADCNNSVNDYFAKFSRSWDDFELENQQLKFWLDPDNTGAEELNGYDPSSGGVITACDSLSNFIGTPTLYLTNNGYLSGTNEYNDRVKAEYFSEIGGKDILTGALFDFGYAEGTISQVTFAVWNDDNGYPGNQIASITYPITNIIEDVSTNELTYIDFNSPVSISGGFFLGVYLPVTQDEKLAVITNAEFDNDINTAWEMNSSGQWYPYDDNANSWGIKLNHAIYPIVCNYVDVEETASIKTEINIFPNPFSDVIHISNINGANIQALRIFNIYGVQVFENNFYENGKAINVDLSSLSPGIYLIDLKTGIYHANKLIVKIK